MTSGGAGHFRTARSFSTGGTARAARRGVLMWGRCVLRQMNPLTLCLLVCLVCGAVTPRDANTASAEPTKTDCEAAIEQTRALVAALPADDLSRYFAERDLHQAMVEAGNGEFDDCLELAARATDEIKQRRHTLQPGERLKVLQPNE
jgi:hypothetical protein